jgi:hypothetical protein
MNFSNLPATLLSLLGTGMAFGLPAASRRAFQRQKVTTSGRTNPGPQELTAGGIADILGGFLIPTLTSMAANALGSRSPQEEALMKMMQQAGGQSPGEQGSENNIERHPAYAEQMASIRHGQGLTSQSFANVGESGSPDQFASEPALV